MNNSRWRPPEVQCPRCGRRHRKFADCVTDALTQFGAALNEPAEAADSAEIAAMARYWVQRNR
jgi:hypothetical protein